MALSVSRILVLHDDPDTQLAIVNTLEDGGHDALPGAPGREALSDIEKWRYDVLLVDVLKRGVSAWYLIRRARRARPAARIIAICQTDGVLQPETLAKLSFLHGADAILTHPIETETLWQLVGAPVANSAAIAPLGA